MHDGFLKNFKVNKSVIFTTKTPGHQNSNKPCYLKLISLLIRFFYLPSHSFFYLLCHSLSQQNIRLFEFDGKLKTIVAHRNNVIPVHRLFLGARSFLFVLRLYVMIIFLHDINLSNRLLRITSPRP